MSSVPATVASVSAGGAIPFPQIGGKKIALGLRTLKYEKELAKLGLPRDTEGLISSILRVREQGLEAKYNLAFHYTLLKKQGAFWKASGHHSLDAWLAAFDLPMGATLAMREHMVKLFSKETFMLAGDDILHEMLREVASYQKDPDKQKKDYQRIFDAYCKSNDAFDKAEFRKTLIWYVRTRYINPTLAKVTDNTAPLPKRQKGERTRKVLVEAEASAAPELPQTESSIEVAVDVCAGCKLWKDYAAQLEHIITSELGAKRLPERPQGI